MASYTAQLLIGEERSDGLSFGPIKQMLLSENSRPVWLYFGGRSFARDPIATWVPERPETILQDGLLMAAYFVARDQAIVAEFQKYEADPVVMRFEVGELPQELLSNLRTACRQCNFGKGQKVIVSVFEGSSVNGQIGVLQEHAVKCEILLSQKSAIATSPH